MSKRVWSSSNPTDCNVCGDVIMDEFVDGKTRDGLWAIMCPACFKQHGVGLGTGKGQQYKLVGADYIDIRDVPPPPVRTGTHSTGPR